MTLIYRAPLSQTWLSFIISVLSMSFIFLFALFYLLLVPFLCYLYFYSIYFWIVVSLILSTPFWPVSTKNIQWWRANRVFEAWRSYFQLSVYSEENLLKGEKKEKILYTFVPHGLFPFGLTLVSGILFKDQDVKIAIASNMFYIPVFGLLLKLLGCIKADKDMFKKYNQIVLIPDGIAGAFYSDRTHERLFLKQRKGFLRHALNDGFSVVPVYCFGHTQLYDVYGWEELSRRLRFAFIFFKGRGAAIWLPHARPVSIVFGNRIIISQDINELHFNYLEEIRVLYNKYKKIVPEWDENKELEFV